MFSRNTKKELPTFDNERVVAEQMVLDALMDLGNQKDVVHEINHMSVFPSKESATLFANWIKDDENELIFYEIKKDKKEFDVHYRHCGSTNYDDITNYSAMISRKSRELGGEYSGWLTSAGISYDALMAIVNKHKLAI